jgi:hypothetical protein
MVRSRGIGRIRFRSRHLHKLCNEAMMRSYWPLDRHDGSRRKEATSG